MSDQDSKATLTFLAATTANTASWRFLLFLRQTIGFAATSSGLFLALSPRVFTRIHVARLIALIES